jgi:hypothetical protein
VTPEMVAATVEALRRSGPASPVGYCRLRGHDRIHLDADDLAVAESHFHDPGDVFLVGRLGAKREATAGLFFWDEGKIHAEFSFLEFPLSAGDLREPSAASRNPRWALAGVGAIALLTLAGLAAPWRSAPVVPRSPEALGLRFEARGSLVRVGWDKSRASITSARSGVLSIREDGRETTVPLAGDQLRTGSVVYTRMSGGDSVRFRLEVTDARSNRISEDLAAQLPPDTGRSHPRR